MNLNSLLMGLGKGASAAGTAWQDQNEQQMRKNALVQQLLQQAKDNQFRQSGLDMQQKQLDLSQSDKLNDNLQNASNRIVGGTELSADSPLTQWMQKMGQTQTVAPHDTMPIGTNPLDVLKAVPGLTNAAPGSTYNTPSAINVPNLIPTPTPTAPVTPPSTVGVDFARPQTLVKPFSEQERKDQEAERGKRDTAARWSTAVDNMPGMTPEQKSMLKNVAPEQGVQLYGQANKPGPQFSADEASVRTDLKAQHPGWSEGQITLAAKNQIHDATATPAVSVPSNERPAWTMAYRAATTDMNKTKAPLANRVEAIDRGLNLIGTGAEGNAMAMTTLIPEYITATAGGMGTGVRITQGEINNSERGRSLRQEILASMQRVQSGQQLTPVQLQQMSEALTSLKESLSKKLDLHNEYEERLNLAGSPDEIRGTLHEFHVKQRGESTAPSVAVPSDVAAALKSNPKARVTDPDTRLVWVMVNDVPVIKKEQ